LSSVPQRASRGCGSMKARARKLAPIYGWFTEGFDTPDLREAKTLLNAVH
jgi:hypothetical protein